jgi:hypothetical protein
MKQLPAKIKIAVNTNHKNKAPILATKEDSDKWFSWYARGFRNIELGIEAWIDLIKQGYAFTSQFSGQRRIMANFITSQHIALDFDHLPAGFTIEQVASYDEFIKSHATFVYTTPSHKEDNPRYRVVFCLDRPISNHEKYRELLLAIATKYSQEHDKACKDSVRLFYGSENCQRLLLGNSLSLEDARDKVVLPLREKQERERLAREAYLKDKVIISKQGVPAEKLQEQLNKLLAPLDGLATDKWNELRKISFTLGGYVGGGYYDFSDIQRKLEVMVGTMKGVTDFDHAYATIEQALSAGMERPLHFLQRTNGHTSPGGQLASRSFVTDSEIIQELQGTSLSDEQKAEVAQRLSSFIETKCWLAYHSGMKEAQKRLWFERYGFSEGVLSMFGLGYREGRIDPETGEIIDSAYTIPMSSYDGSVVNVEYRTDRDEVRYQQETMPTVNYLVNEYFPAMGDKPVLVFPDNLEAMNAMLNLGCFNYAGLPHLPLIQETFDNAPGLPHIVILSPHQKQVNQLNIRLFPRGTRVARLPYEVGKLRGLFMADGVMDKGKLEKFVLGVAN